MSVSKTELFRVARKVKNIEVGGVPEAPEDGNLYGRKDAAWEEVPDVGWRFYSSLDELGLSSPAGLAAICDAMSDKSTMLIDIGDIAEGDRPTSSIFYFIEIVRLTDFRTSIRCIYSGAGESAFRIWVAHWRAADGLSTWRRIPTGERLLWSGAWSSGNITVSGSSDYFMFLLKSNNGTMIVAFKTPGATNGSIWGTGGYWRPAERDYSESITCSFNGNTWTWGYLGGVEHTPSGSHSSKFTRSIKNIYGLM